MIIEAFINGSPISHPLEWPIKVIAVKVKKRHRALAQHPCALFELYIFFLFRTVECCCCTKMLSKASGDQYRLGVVLRGTC